MPNRTPTLGILLLLLTATASAQMAPADRAKVDQAAARVLADTGVPSAIVGIVQNGKIAYTGAYGQANIAAARQAAPEMLYPIGSISKQFTAACMLLLVEDGKLSLEDPVSRFFPDYTDAQHVTLRNLLTHTSGYTDYAPQDYTIPIWTHPTDHVQLAHDYATRPLDFPPGTRWQYSNTNFLIAGMIVEKASGEPFWQFVTRRILQPLGITHAIDLNLTRTPLETEGLQGYMRNALGPPRTTILEFPGWYFADGEMAMPVSDLLRWDIAVMTRNPILKPVSWDALESPMHTQDGANTSYALGLQVHADGTHTVLSHSGEVGGYVAQNTVYPDQHLAIAVLTNEEASSAASQLARAIATELGAANVSAPRIEATTDRAPKPDPTAPAAEKQAQQILTGLEHKKIDRSLFTEDTLFYFNAETISDFATSLAPLGPITRVQQTSNTQRGGMTFRIFTLQFKEKSLRLTTYTLPNGKLEQFLIEP